MVQWWILSSSIRSSNVQSAPEWILLENVPCGHELPTYIPTIIIIITYHTVKLTITMARIVVYYYVLLVDFFKDTKKMSSISPLHTLHLFCVFVSILKSVHFKKTVAQSSFLSKVLSFLLKSKQSQQKGQHFWKKWGLRNCLLKINGL